MAASECAFRSIELEQRALLGFFLLMIDAFIVVSVEDMRLHAGKEESALAMKCHAVNHLRKRMAEYEDS